jgi:hypothetical protein
MLWHTADCGFHARSQWAALFDPRESRWANRQSPKQTTPQTSWRKMATINFSSQISLDLLFYVYYGFGRAPNAHRRVALFSEKFNLRSKSQNAIT